MCTYFMTDKSWGYWVTEVTRWLKYQNWDIYWQLLTLTNTYWHLLTLTTLTDTYGHLMTCNDNEIEEKGRQNGKRKMHHKWLQINLWKAKWISARMLRALNMATLVWFCFSKNSLKARPFMFAQGIYHTTYIIVRLVCSQSCCLPDHHIKRRFT